jgi:hypothetical protein
MWSASEQHSGMGAQGLHDYLVLPWPKGVSDGKDYWPDVARRYWKQAHDTLNSENYDAAAIMARSALQAITRDQEAEGGSLSQEIEDLATKGIISPTIQEWSHEIRLLGNTVAHPNPDEEETRPEDAQDIVKFLDFLLEYLYDLPKQIEEYRTRRSPAEDAA